MLTRTPMIDEGAPDAPFPFDFTVAYRADGHNGIAFRAYGYEAEPVEPEWVLVCPSCSTPVWDGPEGSKLAKCWDCGVAFDTMFDSDEEAEQAGYWEDHDGELRPTGKILTHMIGDDRPFSFDKDELTAIADEDYCSGCGQIGCGWGH